MAEDKGLQTVDLLIISLSVLPVHVSKHSQSGLISFMEVMLFPLVGMTLSLLGAWVTESQNQQAAESENSRLVWIVKGTEAPPMPPLP